MSQNCFLLFKVTGKILFMLNNSKNSESPFTTVSTSILALHLPFVALVWGIVTWKQSCQNIFSSFSQVFLKIFSYFSRNRVFFPPSGITSLGQGGFFLGHYPPTDVTIIAFTFSEIVGTKCHKNCNVVCKYKSGVASLLAATLDEWIYLVFIQ